MGLLRFWLHLPWDGGLLQEVTSGLLLGALALSSLQTGLLKRQALPSLADCVSPCPQKHLVVQVHAAISWLVSTALTSSSSSLPKGSAAASQYRALLLGLMDGLVSAAEEGADVTQSLTVKAALSQTP